MLVKTARREMVWGRRYGMIFRRRGSSGAMISFASLQKAGAHLQTLSVVSNIRYKCVLIFPRLRRVMGRRKVSTRSKSVTFSSASFRIRLCKRSVSSGQDVTDCVTGFLRNCITVAIQCLPSLYLPPHPLVLRKKSYVLKTVLNSSRKVRQESRKGRRG